ncbi:MAG: nicotinamide riboside transporter PnuC [Candidatus Berkiella sp.]
MNWLDPIGAGLSLICTYYFAQARSLAWVFGIAAVSINCILYWQKGIYGSVMLESIYFLSMIYGYFSWSSTRKTLTYQDIRFLNLKQMAKLLLISIAGILVFSFILKKSGSDIPYWDATTSTLALIAQALLCLKYIHCWILWFIVDAMMAAMQLYKGIPFHSAVHWMYLLFAVIGYLRWHKIARKHALVLAA